MEAQSLFRKPLLSPMALGCLNGGGQVKPAPGQTAQQLLEQLDAVYHGPEVEPRMPEDSPTARGLMAEWVQGACFSERARELLHTSYHKREKTVTAMIGDW
jgi:iron only hydrogenase large subunit-like protein